MDRFAQFNDRSVQRKPQSRLSGSRRCASNEGDRRNAVVESRLSVSKTAHQKKHHDDILQTILHGPRS
jgi:hypothetical protein